MTTVKQLKLDIQEMATNATKSVELGGGVYLRVARKYNADYGDVLWYADEVEKQRREYLANGYTTGEIADRYLEARKRLSGLCQLETTLTVLAELDRRAAIVFKTSIRVERDPEDDNRLNVFFNENDFFLPLMANIEQAAIEEMRPKVKITSAPFQSASRSADEA